MDRPLYELQFRAGVLSQLGAELRQQCSNIAAEKSPSSAFDLAYQAAYMSGMDPARAISVAKATRWLAVIRRDHGLDVFQEAVRTLTA